jgi:HEPN domain-containing protein
MNVRTYAPWEHYPKTLTQHEIQNPLTVVKDFFSSDSLKGHAKRLNQWRNFVVSEQFYSDERFGPATLLYLYDLNLKLMEAMYLLFIEDQNTYGTDKVTEEQLEQEKAEWRHFPKNLSVKELKNPYKAIKKVFKAISPQQYREYLHEWIYYALYNRTDNESMYAGEIITVYENLLKVHAAAWVVFQRNTDNTQLKKDWPKIKQETISDQVFELRDISVHPTKAESLGLEELKKVVLKALPTVQMIIHLGTHANPYTYYLLILIDDDEKTPEGELSNKIEDLCRPLSETYVILHKAESAISGINAGQRFWVKVSKKGNVIYQAPGFETPEHGEVTNEAVIPRAKIHWERWGIQGKEFFNGAELYRSQDNYRLAALLLHQSAESTLKAIIQVVLGYRIQMHNLSRMLKLTLLFTDELKSVFHLDTAEGKEEFILLQSSYTQSRYKNEFNPDAKSVLRLSKTIKRLLTTAETLYLQFTNGLKQSTGKS